MNVKATNSIILNPSLLTTIISLVEEAIQCVRDEKDTALSAEQKKSRILQLFEDTYKVADAALNLPDWVDAIEQEAEVIVDWVGEVLITLNILK